MKKKSGTIHLDYASATPIRPSVLKAMMPYLTEEWANPSAIYASGLRVRSAIEAARVTVARLLGVRAEGVIFTSGGTESNNQAIIGYVEALHSSGRAYVDMEIITTHIEHASILEVCSMLEARGVGIVYAALDDEGRIIQRDLESRMTEKTVLLTFAYVNSEIGTIQDVKRITRTVRAWNTKVHASVRVHLDAAQAPLWLSCDMDMLGVDLMSLDAGKCYGPKGSGVLAHKHGVPLSPYVFGGGQEGGKRSGTESAALIVGCARALEEAQHEWKARSVSVQLLREMLFTELERSISGVQINGSREARVANNVHISISGIDSEFAVVTLDHAGIAASTKSACGAGSAQGSHVVRVLTGDEDRATSTIRFTLGEETTERDITQAVFVLKRHVEKMRTFAKTLNVR